MDVPWGASQDPVSLYQALLMKQSLAAAHASGMRFPNVVPVANGMGLNMVDMATLAAAAQAASGRGGYGGGGGGGGYGGHPGMDVHGGYGRRDGGGQQQQQHQQQQRMGPRGGMGGVDVGGYGMGPMGGGGMPRGAMGRGGGGGGGGMYDIVEDVGDGNVYQVQFKRSTRNFLLGKSCQRDLQVKREVWTHRQRLACDVFGLLYSSSPVEESPVS